MGFFTKSPNDKSRYESNLESSLVSAAKRQEQIDSFGDSIYAASEAELQSMYERGRSVCRCGISIPKSGSMCDKCSARARAIKTQFVIDKFGDSRFYL